MYRFNLFRYKFMIPIFSLIEMDVMGDFEWNYQNQVVAYVEMEENERIILVEVKFPYKNIEVWV